MVGRLVEEKYVGFLQKQLGQLDTHTPTARELRGRAAEVLALESEAKERFLHIFLEVGHVDGIELLAHRGHLFDKRHVRIAFIVGACGQFLIHGLYLGFHLVQVGEGLRGFVEDGAAVVCHHVLWKIAYGAVFRHRHRAACRLPHAGKYLEQCALACAVLAHQGYAVFGVDYKRDVLEKRCATEFYGKRVY